MPPISYLRSCVIAATCLALTACAAVDQFGSRVDDANTNSQDATNRETLLNIVRASKYQPLNFIAITQVSGSQTESVTTGLPTVSIGPAQTAANHIYQISNSVNSQANGSYQSNPLISAQFTTGMLAPISPTTLAYLTAAHPRETVLHLTIEAIVLRHSRKMYRFRNLRTPDEKVDECVATLRNNPNRLAVTRCNYTQFVDVLSMLIERGLTAELVPDINRNGAESGNGNGAAPVAKAGGGAAGAGAGGSGAATGGAGAASGAATSGGGSGSGGDKTPLSAKGRFCFDPTRSNVKSFQPFCGDFRQSRSDAQSKVLKADLPGIGLSEVTIVARSPFGAYRAIGEMTRYTEPWRFYLSDESNGLVQEHREPFVNISETGADGCFAWIVYEATNYCVPRYSRHTALLFNILQELRNLSTSPNDLNAAFSVRLVSN